MRAAVVVPADEFGEYTSKMPLIPDQHSVETLPAQRSYHPLNVCRRLGRAIRNRYPPDAHLLSEPLIVCRSTRHPFPYALNLQRTSELAELSVVVVEHELGLLLEAGIPDLLFRPFKRWVIRYVEVNYLSTREFHDGGYVENTKPNRRLHKEVSRPNGSSLVLQKASPGLGIYWSRRPFDHGSPDRRAGVANTKLHLQLQGDAILPVPGMIGEHPPDEADVFIGDRRPPWLSLRLLPPEIPKTLVSSIG
jgi:hypothetical protein